MMAAATIAQQAGKKAHVILYEKNAYLGAKVLISGGGRCNVTTGIFDVRTLIENYPRGGKFLLTAFYHLPPEKVIEWFNERGVPLKTEEDMRVFPVSDNGEDVVGALKSELNNAKAEVIVNAQVTTIKKDEEGFIIETKKGEPRRASIVVLATGGNAYRHTGSTGDGYAFAQQLGHTITPLGPSLSAFTVEEKWIKNIAGVSIEKAQLRLTSKHSENVYERTGAFVFTHHGVSGPAIFALSAYAAYEKVALVTPWQLSINFFPYETAEQLEHRLKELLQKNAKKKAANVVDILLPKSLCDVVMEKTGFDPELTAAHVSKEQIAILIGLLRNFSLTVVARTAGEEFVSAGGVSLDEVDSRTMESKFCPGLYITGELLDVDGFTGGFNLQASWATGHLAAEDITKKLT